MLKKILTMDNVYDFSTGSDEKTEFRFFRGPNLTTKDGKRTLEVSFSSMDYENTSLLHFLLNKSKN